MKNLFINRAIVAQRVRKSELGETVVLDVDTNRIETPFNDLESLPPDIVSIISINNDGKSRF